MKPVPHMLQIYRGEEYLGSLISTVDRTAEENASAAMTILRLINYRSGDFHEGEDNSVLWNALEGGGFVSATSYAFLDLDDLGGGDES